MISDCVYDFGVLLLLGKHGDLDLAVVLRG